ncbi:MAG: sialidase family protein [Candidatus Latescibacterota bacterium]
MRKLEDIVIYKDEDYYAAFPSIVSCPDGELLVAFRRAPERKKFYATQCTHTDPNSYLVLVRSRDLGHTWSTEPELIYAHPLGGSQDPCMVQLDDGALLVTSYAWMLLPEEGIAHLTSENRMHIYGWAFTFLGGYLMRSGDRGRSWEGPILPPEIEDQAVSFPGIPIPAVNRGAMVQARDGNLYWIVASSPKTRPGSTVLDLMISRDRGRSWEYAGPVASDDTVSFNETSLIETENGDLVAFVRTANFDDHGVVVRSKDHGKTWEPWQDMGIIGHPHHALPLPDGRVYLLYGYRHEPYGIRARILDPECTDFSGEEIVLRDDGGAGDLGYPWSCITADGRILSVYYFNQKDGTRYIAGTFLEIG